MPNHCRKCHIPLTKDVANRMGSGLDLRLCNPCSGGNRFNYIWGGQMAKKVARQQEKVDRLVAGQTYEEFRSLLP